MTDRPILFSSPMVRALIERRKTQTRRLAWNRWTSDLPPKAPLRSTPWQLVQPGDRLWVRETFCPLMGVGARCSIAEARYVLFADGAQRYRDGFMVEALKSYVAGAFDGIKWSPGIHLPRWASRITLTVEAVKIERLKEISAADAEAEGVVYETADPGFWYVPGFPHNETGVGIEERAALPHASRSYLKLWRLLHGADSLRSNPEVVALTFAVTLANIDCMVPPCVETAPREMTA